MVVGVFLVAAVVFVEQAQRRIPVQYAKRMVGRRMYGGTSTYIPLKVNQAGIIPVIFASSLLYLPQLLASLFANAENPTRSCSGSRGTSHGRHAHLHDRVLRPDRVLHLLLRVHHLQPRLKWPTT